MSGGCMRSASVILRCSTSISDSTSKLISLPCVFIICFCSATAGTHELALFEDM